MRADPAGQTRRQALAALSGAALLPLAPAAAAMALDPALPPWRPARVPAPSGGYLRPDGTIRIVGTQNMQALVGGLNRRFAQAHGGFAFGFDVRPGLMAIGPAAYGTTPFAPMPRLFTPVELAAFRAIAGREPVAIRVAHGSVVARDRTAVLAIYVNKANPIAHLSLDQVVAIFGTGQPHGDIRSWGQLGLTGDWARRRIHPVGTPEDTGFGSFMVQQRMGGLPLSPDMTVRATSAGVMAIVGGDVGAIGYSAINFATADTRTVPIGAAPAGPWMTGSADEVMAGGYPLDRFVYLYALPLAGGGLEPWLLDYFRLVLSADGQRVVAESAGSFLPLRGDIVSAERAMLARAVGGA